MNILNREELCKLIQETNCINSTIINNDLKKVYFKESSIQPSSVDLHIGELFIPEKDDNSVGGKFNPNTKGVILKPGGSLLVRIEEEIKLPLNIGGVCFAPANLSLQGLLIINIGHIDPGFEGKLHFTVVNLGKEEFSLRKNDVICTLLLFKLSKETLAFGKESIVECGDKKTSQIVNDCLPRLSNTFMDFENNTSKIVKGEITKANFRIPLIIAIITVGLPFISTFFFNIYSYNNKLEKRIESLENQIQTMQKEADLIKKLIQ